MPKKLALLHTSPVHIKTFDALLAKQATAVVVEHIVAESLLERARREGLTAALQEDVAQLIGQAVANEADVVLCTCSTIGELAEATAERVQKPVLRLDRPMAETAVLLANRIIIAATLASTLKPTAELIHAAAHQANKSVELVEWLCADAWPKFEAGDMAGYWQAIADSLQPAPQHGDVIVLAQGSMAGAAPLCAHLSIPILTSTELGLAAALAKL